MSVRLWSLAILDGHKEPPGHLPLVVIPRSSRKLSVKACCMFALSSSRAMNMMHAHTMMRQSILRTRRCSSPHVQRAEGSKRW